MLREVESKHYMVPNPVAVSPEANVFTVIALIEAHTFPGPRAVVAASAAYRRTLFLGGGPWKAIQFLTH